MANYPIYRLIKGTTLSFTEMDDNFRWLSGNMSASVVTITGSTYIAGNLTVSQGITGSLFGTSSWAENAVSSSYPISITGSTIYSVIPKKYDIATTQESVVLGSNALSESIGSNDYSVIIGAEAGVKSSLMQYSVLLGYNTGKYASGYYDTVAIGDYAMYSASGDYHTYEITTVGSATLRGSYNVGSMSVLGSYSGYGSRNMDRVTIIGIGAGQEMNNVNESDFIGYDAGYRAGSITEGLYMGFSSGRFAVSSSGTIAIGYNSVMESVAANHTIALGHKSAFGTSGSSYSVLLGYNVGNIEYLPFSRVNSIGRNNIIIGTNISLPAGRKDSINLGAIIFATGSYFNGTEGPYNETGNNFSGSVGNGKVGINVINPVFNLDVSGSGRYTNGLTVTGSITGSNALFTGTIIAQTLLVQTITSSTEWITGSSKFGSLPTDTHQFTGSVLAPSITGSLLGTSSWAISASYSVNAISASYVSGSAAIIINLTSSNDASINGLTIGKGNSNQIENTVVGQLAFYSNLTGTRSTAIGFESLYSNSTGRFNTAVGWDSMYRNSVGEQNVAVGYSALQSNQSGSFNTIVGGSNTAYEITSGSWNTIIGTNSGRTITTGNNNTIIGGRLNNSFSSGSPFTSTLSNNIILGDGAGNIKYRYDGTLTNIYSNLYVSGSVTAISGFTGSLFGTSSWSQNSVTSSNFNGTGSDGFVSNMSDTYTGTAKIKDIVTLTAAEYSAIGAPLTSTLYVVI